MEDGDMYKQRLIEQNIGRTIRNIEARIGDSYDPKKEQTGH